MNKPISKPIQGYAMRQHTKDVIQERIRRLQAEIDQLKILDSALPWKDMTEQEEGELWDFFTNLRR